MKSEWPLMKIGDVCQIQPPKSEARKAMKGSDAVSFVPMECLGIRQKFFNVEQERPLEAVAGSYTYFADGDVLLAKMNRPGFRGGQLV